MNAPDALILEGIERRYGRSEVLLGADLRVAPGTVAWLGGANGAGKTTLLRVAVGVLIPHAGRVAVDGLDPERDRRAFHRRLGYVPAGDRGLQARLTVAQNLGLWAGLALVPRHQRPAAVARAQDRFALGELARRRVDRLSMGQRQRVRLACAFLHDPRLIVLDEPHNSLDDAALTLLERAFHEARQRGGAILWCSPAHSTLPLSADVRHILECGRVQRA